jgi:hypothetical protein
MAVMSAAAAGGVGDHYLGALSGQGRRPWRGSCGVGVSGQGKPTRQPRSGAVGQWAGAVRIVRSLVRGRPDLRLSPITGAGLDPSCAPAGIPSSGSDGEGCWGRETAGTDAHSGIEVVRVVAVPHGRAGVVRIVDPGAAAQQLNDPPSSATQAQGRDREAYRNKKISGACGATANSRKPTANG